MAFEQGLLLLVASQVGCWRSLLMGTTAEAEKAVAAWCAFYWLWALKNRVFGPLKEDMGVLTFGFGAFAFALLGADGAGFIFQELRIGPLALTLTSCGFATANYALPVVAMARMESKDRWDKVARKMRKSLTFAKVFFLYCVSNLAFWPTAFVLLHPRLRGDIAALPEHLRD